MPPFSTATRGARGAGTPAYMAPEQHLRLQADARSDQFAFCVTAWETIYGVRPFTAGSLVMLTVRVTEGRMDPPPPDIRVPNRIRAALVRGLASQPDDRWPSMDALLGELATLDADLDGALADADGHVAVARVAVTQRVRDALHDRAERRDLDGRGERWEVIFDVDRDGGSACGQPVGFGTDGVDEPEVVDGWRT